MLAWQAAAGQSLRNSHQDFQQLCICAGSAGSLGETALGDGLLKLLPGANALQLNRAAAGHLDIPRPTGLPRYVGSIHFIWLHPQLRCWTRLHCRRVSSMIYTTEKLRIAAAQNDVSPLRDRPCQIAHSWQLWAEKMQQLDAAGALCVGKSKLQRCRTTLHSFASSAKLSCRMLGRKSAALRARLRGIKCGDSSGAYPQFV